MQIKLIDILSYSGLKSARAIAGINGLNRPISHISAYDRDFVDDFYDNQGVLYLSTLVHLKNSKTTTLEWFKRLYESGACGLILVEEALQFLDDETIAYCNKENFPVVVIDNDVTYAEIIEHVSVLLFFNNLYIKQEERVKHIIYDKISNKEKIDTLLALCPKVKSSVMVLAVRGNLQSDMYERELSNIVNKDGECIFVPMDEMRLVIVSGDAEAACERKITSLRKIIIPYFESAVIGESKGYDQIDIDKGIKSALMALRIAGLKHAAYEKYDDFSDYALLLAAQNSEEIAMFYNKFMDTLNEVDSSGKMDYINCIREYVASKGDYSIMAKNLYQHENTMRYRINKIKTLLGYEDDTIKFNEIISIFVAIDRLQNE